MLPWPDSELIGVVTRVDGEDSEENRDCVSAAVEDNEVEDTFSIGNGTTMDSRGEVFGV